MIITNVCLLLEALSIVICLHHLHGEKFKFDILTVSYLSINMISMTTINYFELPRNFTMIIYPFLFLYCGFRFEFQFKRMLMDIILCVVIVGGSQLLATVPFCFISDAHFVSDIKLLIMNFISFSIICGILPKCNLKGVIDKMAKKERTLLFSLVICVLILVLCIMGYKELRSLELYQAILLFVSIVFIFFLTGQLSLYKVKAKEIETELKMHRLYADSFSGLIDNIRTRQHEFDNHISTIYSQHYIYKTYEELVLAQDNYCQMISEENRFNKLLSKGNPIIIGFLYGKFVEIDKLGIEISYRINIGNLDVEVPTYKIIEILGNLIKNAVEALLKNENGKKLYISMVEQDNYFEIEARNESEIISYNEINAFFTRGYSKKGENRGLGLYNVNQICKEYKLEVKCQNEVIDESNWLVFQVKNKETI